MDDLEKTIALMGMSESVTLAEPTLGRVRAALVRERAVRPVLDAAAKWTEFNGSTNELLAALDAYRAAVGGSAEEDEPRAVSTDVEVPFTARAAACNLLMNAREETSIPELADIVLRETAPYVVAANSPQPEEAMGMVGMRGHLLGVLGREDDPMVSTFELLEEALRAAAAPAVAGDDTQLEQAPHFGHTQDVIEDALVGAGYQDLPGLADIVFVATEAARDALGVCQTCGDGQPGMYPSDPSADGYPGPEECSACDGTGWARALAEAGAPAKLHDLDDVLRANNLDPTDIERQGRLEDAARQVEAAWDRFVEDGGESMFPAMVALSAALAGAADEEPTDA